jgi:periplasmic protein TonB
MGALMHRSDNRVIHYAVLASIVFHGLLLALAPRQDSKRAAALPGPIIARLVQPAAVAPQAEPQKPQAEPQQPSPATAEPALTPKPSPIAKPAPKAPMKPIAPATPQKAAPSTPSAEPSAPASPAAPAASSTPGPVAKADPQPGAPATAPPSVDDAGSLAQYRMQLIGMAKRYKRYPRAAMDNNWEGDVVVRMVIGANGMIASMSIKTSSGHDILDKQAIDMFTKAKPLVPIPGALRGKEFTIEVRAIYNLKDPDSG